MLIDSHCHIEEDIIAWRAFNAGVTGMLNAGKDADEAEEQLKMCQRFKDLRDEGKDAPLMWTSAGVHPENAKDKIMYVHTKDLVNMAQSPFVVAIGECGLDYHYDKEYQMEQKMMFINHIDAAGQTGLPLMIHQREAEYDMVRLLRLGKEKYPKLRGVIHCFSSDPDFARVMDELGFYISASGIITFHTADYLANIFKDHPNNKILIETDSPYLAPVPYRGKINEPAYIVKTVEKLAELKNITVAKAKQITSNNFYRLYPKAKEQKKCLK